MLPMRRVLRIGLAAVSTVAAVAACGLVPATPGTFSSTGSMGAQREGHTATLLADGRVLIAGGEYGCCMEWTQLRTAEVYDPATGSFHPTGSMTGTITSRDLATLLPDGRVLIVSNEGAELYDPEAGTFAATGSPLGSPEFRTATLLQDGRVLLAGAYDNSSQAPAELYDPRTGSFSLTGSLLYGCEGGSATLLKDGRVLFLGCGDPSWTSDKPDELHDSARAELYDPASGSFTLTGAMTRPRDDPTATLLADGRVLVSGGFVSTTRGPGDYLASAELYDPVTGTFSATGDMTEQREGHSATLLPNGMALVAGGSNWDWIGVTSAELFDPATGTFRRVSSGMTAGRRSGTTTLLKDGRVLFTGGRGDDDSQLASAELYNPLLDAAKATNE
jgi:large repetitive protein